MKRIFGLVPNVFFLSLVSLLNDFSSEMIYAVMPAFLVTVLGAPPLFVGLLEGFADALASVLKIVSGWFSDKIRRRKVIAVWGYSLSAVTRVVLAAVTSFWQVFVIRVIDRMGKGMREAPRDALLAESVEQREVGKSFGFHRAMDTVGGILGPLAALALLPILMGNYRTLFLIGAGAGVLAILTFVFVREGKPRDGLPHVDPPRFSFSVAKFSREFKLFIAAIFVFGLGSMPISLMLLKAREIGEMGSGIPLMYVIYSIAFVIFAFPFGKLSDMIGQRRVIIGGFFAAILAYVVLGSFDGFGWIVAGFTLFGLYGAMTDGLQRAFASKLVSHEVLASGQGFLGAAVGLSSLLAGLVGGGIWTLWGANWAFTYGAIMMSIGLVTFINLNGSRRGI